MEALSNSLHGAPSTTPPDFGGGGSEEEFLPLGPLNQSQQWSCCGHKYSKLQCFHLKSGHDKSIPLGQL